MSLKEGVLGLLLDGPKSGYAIKKLFSKGIKNFWTVSDGQLYPTLRKMNNEGLITKEVVSRPKSVGKHLYHITDDGREHFMVWLREPEHRFEKIKEWAFLLKLFFFDKLGRDEILEHVDAQIKVHKEFLAECRLLNEIMRKELSNYQKMIMDVGTMYMEFRFAWLVRLRRIVEEDKVSDTESIVPEEAARLMQQFFSTILSGDPLDTVFKKQFLADSAANSGAQYNP